MNLVEYIPIGKKHREERNSIMARANIFDVNIFKKELSLAKKKYIILYDDGYYMPASKEEYQEFIDKMNQHKIEITDLIERANKEMEEL